RDRGDVGADAEEGRLSERHLAGVAHCQVEAERRHQVHAVKRQQVDLAALQIGSPDRDRDEDDGENTRLEGRFHTLRSSGLPSSPSGRNRMTPKSSTSATPSLYAGET